MKLELSLYAVNLKNVAGAFKGTSDPYAIVTDMSTGSKPTVIGKTEVIENTLNPEWVNILPLDYELGKPMKLVITIMDDDKNQKKHKTMGCVVFDIGEVLGSRGNTKAKRIPNSTGTVFASVRQLQQGSSGVLRFTLKGYKLTNTEGFMSKSDPFYELSRNINAAGGLTWDNVYRSNIVKNNLNPAWDRGTVELNTLCGGDVNLPIRLDVFDQESNGKHVLMGTVDTSVQKLIDASTKGNADDTSKAISITVKGKETGKIIVVEAVVDGLPKPAVPVPVVTEQLAKTSLTSTTKAPSNNPTFVDYITGGCQLNVVVAIDFTGSNGDPRQPGTLHHFDANTKNDYEKAISAIVEVLAQYDEDQVFPVYGFGAKFNGIVNHCFPVAGSTANGVRGVDKILEAYNDVFKMGFVMSSPTVFTEVIDTAANTASAAVANGKQAYTILLIVTDGAVSDPTATANCITRIAPTTPMSIVIVGVGNANFTTMQFLDDLKGTTRDIVQFVEFNKFSSNKTALTEATLCEIPNQLVQYFVSKNIMPNPPVTIHRNDVPISDSEEVEIDLSVGLEGDIVVSDFKPPTQQAW